MADTPSETWEVALDTEKFRALGGLRILRSIANHANAKEFLGHAPGTVELLGARGMPANGGFQIVAIFRDAQAGRPLADFDAILFDDPDPQPFIVESPRD